MASMPHEINGETRDTLTGLADQAQALHPSPVLQGLGDLSGVIGGQLWRLPAASRSIPAATQAVEQQLKTPESAR